MSGGSISFPAVGRAGAGWPRLAVLLPLVWLSGCAALGSMTDRLCEAGDPTRLECLAGLETFDGEPVAAAAKSPSGAREKAYNERLGALIANNRLPDSSPDLQAAADGDRAGFNPDAAPPVRLQLAREAARPLLDGPPAVLPARSSRPGDYRFDEPWRRAANYLYIDLPGKGEAKGKFAFSGLHARQATIFLRSIASVELKARLICDGRARLRTADGGRKLSPGESTSFTIPARERDGTSLILPEETGNCVLDIMGAAGGSARRIAIVREEEAYPALGAIDSGYEVCAIPVGSRLTALQSAFFGENWLSKSCVEEPKGLRLLPKSRDGFNAKMQALTGTELSDAEFDAADPYMAIDFSHAPQLDMIFASYLDIKADFSGAVFLRALRLHAERGTLIRILITAILERPKDRALLEKLAADFPNVQLQEFVWKPGKGATTADYIAAIHRSNHVKMLATFARDKSRSRLFIGGRNIHDGFLFEEAQDLSAFPELHNYGKPSGLSINYFASYLDLEMEVTGDAVIRRITGQLAALWHRDPETSVSRLYSMPVPARTEPTGMRHFLSVPYNDEKALERWYVELIDGASDIIEIVTPYLNPTPAIEAALVRARARNVKVIILARINLLGDLGSMVLTNLNKSFVEKRADDFEIYEYRPEKTLLHSKMLMIDRQLTIVSSINLNHRSFLHDTENGLAVLDRAYYRKASDIFNLYHSRSRRLTTKVDIPILYRMLLQSRALRNAM